MKKIKLEFWDQTYELPCPDDLFDKFNQDILERISLLEEEKIISTPFDEIDARNIGATECAKKLLIIARSGEKKGVFGGQEIEECAKVIIGLHKDRNDIFVELLSRMTLEEKQVMLEMLENTGALARCESPFPEI